MFGVVLYADTHTLGFTLAEVRYLRQLPSHSLQFGWYPWVCLLLCVLVYIFVWEDNWGYCQWVSNVTWMPQSTSSSFKSTLLKMSFRIIPSSQIKSIFTHYILSDVSPQHQQHNSACWKTVNSECRSTLRDFGRQFLISACWCQCCTRGICSPGRTWRQEEGHIFKVVHEGWKNC